MSTFIFPMNPEWYDAERAFKNLPDRQVDWGTERPSVSVGDKVLIYFSEPTKEMRILSEVVKILDSEDTIIDDSSYIREGCPENIRNPRGSRRVIRLELKKIIKHGTGLDYNSFWTVCGYRGHFQRDFCVNNSENELFRKYLKEKLGDIS